MSATTVTTTSTPTTLKVNSSQLEMMVLGCMLNSFDDLKAGLEVIEVEDFADNRNKIIFKSLQEIEKSKDVVDITIVAESLKQRGRLSEIGGYNYLMGLSILAGSGSHILAYADDLRKETIKRTLLEVSRNIIYDVEKGIESYTILDRLERQVENVKANKPKSDSIFRHLLDSASEAEVMKEIKNTSAGVRVGFELGKIDLKIPGGAITIVAGQTGHGKTMVLINFILNYLELYPAKQAFFFSYEESRGAILSLFLNTYINQELSKNNRESVKSYFRDGHAQFITQESQEFFLKKKEQFFSELIETKRLNILYSDYHAEELVQAIRFLRKNTEAGIVVVDYMQLLSVQNKKTMPRQEELKQICLMLKDCAVLTGLPILIAAQFNRTVSAEADLSPTAIGEAGDIERAANMIIGIWNRNCQGLSRDGNKGKDGKVIPQAPQMYMEVLKGRETGIGHSAVFDLNGNTGKLSVQRASTIFGNGKK